MDANATDRHLTPGDVAARLQVEPETVVSWIRRGLLPGYRLPRGDYRIAESDLARVLRPTIDPRPNLLTLAEVRGRR